MDTSKLRKFATFARSSLIEQVVTRLKTVLAEKSLSRRESPIAVKELESKIKDLGEKRVVEAVAYIWFNRFCALRYMDVNRYTRIGVLSPAEGQFQPEILAEAKMGHIDEELVPEATRKQVMRLLDGSDKSTDAQGEAYRLLLVAVCNYYHSLMPFMFEKIADYTELLLPDDLLSGTSIPAYTREALLPINCSPEHTEESVEVIGWLYQFYISEEKDAVMARKAAVPTDDIPAVTQLFTPHWIVRYLVENSLGRLWLLNHPDSKLRERMPYYIEGETESDFPRVSKPEEIRVLDPACGSGHMLTYAYDLLYTIYDEQGYSPTEIPGLILQHNLVGLEICDRAAALSAFALCMKARASDSRYFRRVMQPNITSLQNIHIENDELEDYVDSLALSDLFDAPVRKLLQQFEHAKDIGSLIQPCISESQIQSVRSEIENRKSEIENSPNQLFLRELHLKVLQVLEQAEKLTLQNHVVVANPPYLGMANANSILKRFADDIYPTTKADTFAMFIERSSKLASQHGYAGLVTMQSWLFLSSYADLREKLLTTSRLINVVHIGPRGFDSIAGHVVQTVAFVVKTGAASTGPTKFLRLVDYPSEATKEAALLKMISSGGGFLTTAAELRKIEGAPISYWIPAKAREHFEKLPALKSVNQPRTGISTGANERFILHWTEVSHSEIGLGLASKSTKFRYYPHNKGGDTRVWYGNQSDVLKYSAKDITAMERCAGFRHDNAPFYFRPSASWTKISSGRFASRYYPQGFTFNSASVALFEPELLGFLGLLNSNATELFVSAVSGTLNFTVGEIAKIPVCEFPTGLVPVVEELVTISRLDWDNFETSWDFRDHPLLRQGLKCATLQASWRSWEVHSTTAIRRMQELETENNRLFIAAYGLEGELQPEVPEVQISLARADVKKDIAAFLSYAVGCMMGRYSPDHPGLILANAGDTLREFLEKVDKPLAELNFAPDEDGIIPVLEGEWFDDDIVARTRDFLRATFGEATLAENLRFIEASLGKDLRKYFLNDFYKDHLQTYKKRPIYWLFSSPKGTFNALIYMHRYRPDTVGTVLHYLRDFRDKLTHHADHQQMLADSASASKSEKTQAIKDVAAIKKQLKELEDYEKTLFEVAARKIDIDLDDGVKHNYQLFGSVLRKIPGLDAKGD
jgi:hypothetical protein